MGEVIERRGEGGGRILIVEMGRKEDRRDLLERSWEVRRRWGIRINEDLTLEERRIRWRIKWRMVKEGYEGRGTGEEGKKGKEKGEGQGERGVRREGEKGGGK